MSGRSRFIVPPHGPGIVAPQTGDTCISGQIHVVTLGKTGGVWWRAQRQREERDIQWSAEQFSKHEIFPPFPRTSDRAFGRRARSVG